MWGKSRDQGRTTVPLTLRRRLPQRLPLKRSVKGNQRSTLHFWNTKEKQIDPRFLSKVLLDRLPSDKDVDPVSTSHGTKTDDFVRLSKWTSQGSKCFHGVPGVSSSKHIHLPTLLTSPNMTPDGGLSVPSTQECVPYSCVFTGKKGLSPGVSLPTTVVWHFFSSGRTNTCSYPLTVFIRERPNKNKQHLINDKDFWHT